MDGTIYSKAAIVYIEIAQNLGRYGPMHHLSIGGQGAPVSVSVSAAEVQVPHKLPMIGLRMAESINKGHGFGPIVGSTV